MTAHEALRAALEKYSKFLEASGYIDSDWWQEYADPIETFIAEEGAPILEAMQQHRAEAIEELEAWVTDHINEFGYVNSQKLKAKLAALKTNQHGNI